MQYLPAFRRLSLRCAGRFLLSSALAGSIIMNAEAGTASPATFTFTATFVAPSCTMDIPTLVDFTPDGSGGIQSAALTGAGVNATGGMAISFSNCSSNSMARPPKIVVIGRTVSLGGSELYFADEPSLDAPANSYGIKLSLSGQPDFVDSLNIATKSGASGGGEINAIAGSSLSSLNNTTLNLTANLSCGSYSPCNSAPGYASGVFKATVTFQLAYD